MTDWGLFTSREQAASIRIAIQVIVAADTRFNSKPYCGYCCTRRRASTSRPCARYSSAKPRTRVRVCLCSGPRIFRESTSARLNSGSAFSRRPSTRYSSADPPDSPAPGDAQNQVRSPGWPVPVYKAALPPGVLLFYPAALQYCAGSVLPVGDPDQDWFRE